MIHPLQLPETCSCCQTSGGGSGGGGSGDCDCQEWHMEGTVHPEGAVTADRKTIYLWRDESHFIFFYKGSGDGTPFGWEAYHEVFGSATS